MKMSKNFAANKAKTAAVITIVLLMASVMFIAVSVNPVQAQLSTTQPYSGALKSGDVATGSFSTTAQISARPNLVGLGQPVMFNLWITPASLSNRRLLDYKVTITKPDGTKDEWTLNSEIDTAATWFEYVVDQVGEYTYKFDFPGTYLPAGRYYNGYIVTNTSGTLYSGSTYYQPSSSPVSSFTVQTEMVPSWSPTMAPPSDYWTRPVPPELREWVTILGDYPWYGPGTLDWSTRYPNCSAYWNPSMTFFPYVQGPNSAHVVWKNVENSAGITGAGRYTDYGTRGWLYEVPSSTASSSPGTMPMVIAGRGYRVVNREKPEWVGGTIQNILTSVWQCVDIRTGEVFWERDWYGLPQSQQSFGGWVFKGFIEYPSLTICYINGDRLYKFDRNTGAMTLNASIAPLSWRTSMYGEFSGVVPYMNGFALGVQDIGNATVPNYRLINFTTTGTSSTLASRIVSNISWPISSVPITTDYDAGIAVLGPDNGWIDTSGTTLEQRLITVSLTTGQVLVNKTIAPAGGEFMSYSTCTSICDHGILAFLTDWGYFVGFDIRTGDVAWTGEKMDYPWDVCGFGAYDINSAYGMFYRCGYSGVYAFDWKTGKIVWKYKAPALSPFESPYIDETGATVYSFNGVAIVADGKIYTYNTEHSPTQPITRGWQVHAIDAFTGKEVFKVMLSGGPDFVADGYLGVSESYTGTYYVLGRGKSQTTVTAPDTAVPLGTAVLIKGTIVDMSPAQPGTPCVSKDSMATQMEYLHKQMPLSGLWGNETITGVPVTLTAIGSDGTVIDIGTTTTNGYYGTFSKAWTPPKEDTYTIIATFAADDSYGSSAAGTGLVVGPAPASPTPTPEQPQTAPDNTPLIYATLAIIVAIVIVGLLIILALRKRQ